MLADLSVATTLMKGERIKALAVSSAQRLAEWPDIPTFAEAGYKDYDLVVWVGLAAPAGTPPEVAQKINAAINKALTQQDIRNKFHGLGMQAAPNSMQEQNEFVRSQRIAWQQRMSEANILPE